MAFVWSRLALAAVLAAGAACAPTETCPELAKASACGGDECDGPRLICSEGTAFVLFGDDLDDNGNAISADEASAAAMPRVAVLVDEDRAHAAPPAQCDVLLVAPKTSPPRT